MTIESGSLEFSVCSTLPDEWPKLTCSAPNELALYDAGLKLDAGRTMRFEGDNGTVRTGELQVLQDINADGNLAVGGTAVVSNNTTLQGNLHVDGTTLFDGNVAINTPVSAHQLDVNGTINATAVYLNGTPLAVSPWDNATGGINYTGGNVGVGTASPLFRLHVTANGGFGSEQSDGTSGPGNVPIVAQSNSTAIGIINGSGRPAFALNINNNAGTTDARGVPTFYDRYNGAWHNSLSLRNGNVGIDTTNPMEKLHVNGSIRGNQSGALRISTGHGYVDIGPKNTNWSHFYTDREKFYFNREIRVDSGRIGSYNENLYLRTSGTTRLTIRNDSGNVGIGTSSPGTSFHVRAKKAASTFKGHVAIIESSAGYNADVLALKVNKSKPAANNNFISFYGSGSSTIGAIQGNGTGGVVYVGPGNDYAEWLPRLHENEIIAKGDIVGLFDGKISKDTDGAQHLMVASSNPIVVGNMPQCEQQHAFTQVAFIGQTPVKVNGPVDKGDYIVASGLNDGAGIAVSQQQMTLSQFGQVVGRVWEGSDELGTKLVNTAVALNPNQSLTAELLSQMLQAQQAQNDDLRRELTYLAPVA